MHDNTPVINDGNGTEIRTYFILRIRCNSITSVWGGKTPHVKRGFFFPFPALLKHSFLLASCTISPLWTFHYGCPTCNNRNITIFLQVSRQFGFYLFYVWRCLQIALAVLLRLTSKPNGCSTGIISVLVETFIPPFLTMKHTWLENRQSQHPPCGWLPPCWNLISFIIHGSC